MKLLAAAGADVNVPNMAQATPLHEAILGGNTECVRALLDARADPDGRANNQANRNAPPGPGNRQCGFFRVRLEVVSCNESEPRTQRVLVGRPLPPFPRGCCRLTIAPSPPLPPPLPADLRRRHLDRRPERAADGPHHPSPRGCRAGVRLGPHGARVAAARVGGERARARPGGEHPAARGACARGGVARWTRLHTTHKSHKSSPPLTHAFLSHQSPRPQAARGGDAEVCEWLIASGADLLAANDDGSTPLHLAASAGQVVPSMVLIAAGAPLDARDGAPPPPSRWGQLGALLGGSETSDGKRPLDVATGARTPHAHDGALSTYSYTQPRACAVGSAFSRAVIEPLPEPPAARAADVAGDAAQLLWHVNDWVAERENQPCMVASSDFVASSRALQRACVRLLLLQKAKMDGHLKESVFEEKAQQIVDEVVAERKLNDVLVSLYKDKITQHRAEQLAASIVGLLPKDAQPGFKRQFPDLFEKREKSGELSIYAPGQIKPDRHGNTPLHRAAAAGEVEKVKKLINEARAAEAGRARETRTCSPRRLFHPALSSAPTVCRAQLISQMY